METLYLGAKLFPEDPYFATPINLHFFLTQPECPVIDPALPKACRFNVRSHLAPECHLPGCKCHELFHDHIPSLCFQPTFIPTPFRGAEEWRGPVQHMEVFGRSLESEEEMGVGVVLRPYSVTSSTL